ncbi:MAG TPA: DUF192 domain-containing protein [Microvirga sp.]|nr:DUF192 domain-containing protein [Microvirga sp.]
MSVRAARSLGSGAVSDSRSALAAWILIVLTVVSALPAAASPMLEPLAIVTQGGQRHAFKVEVARNDADRAQGLMFRRSMPPDWGMLFDFGRVEPVSMWMKNTYLPLDMLFIRPDGSIARIAANAEPLSTRAIPSGEPVLAVLELNAGTAARLGIRAGDRVEHPLFKS